MGSISVEEDDYYLILPSNVPSVPGSALRNRPDEFRTTLPRPLEFSRPDQWEIGLSEIIYPQTFSASIKLKECNFQFRQRKENPRLVRWVEEQQRILERKELTIVERRTLEEYRSFLPAYQTYTEIHSNCSTGRGNTNLRTYEDLASLIAHLKSSKPAKMSGEFKLDDDGRVVVTLQKYEMISLDPMLAETLGFTRHAISSKDGTAISGQEQQQPDNSADEESGDETRDEFFRRMFERIYRQMRLKMANRNTRFWSIKAEQLSDLRMSCYSMFIYSNMVRETLAGNVYVKILRAVPIRKENDGKTIGISFHPMRYRPLASNFFEYVDIKLCDDMGRNLEFQSGKVIVTLRIRRRKRNRTSDV